MHRWLRATINTWHGLREAVRSEAAFRQELIALGLSVPIAFLVATDAWKRFLLIGVVVFVMVVELLNTSIEKLADRGNREIDPTTRPAKDSGSAAVGLALTVAGLAWLIALAERLGIL